MSVAPFSTHGCCAEAAVNAHHLTSVSSNSADPLAGAQAASAATTGDGSDRGLPTPLHVYTRGLPMSVEVLELLLDAAGGPDGNSRRIACSIADEGFNSQLLESGASDDQFGLNLISNTAGLRPLHYVVLWPMVRINPQVPTATARLL